MPADVKSAFLRSLAARFGPVRKLNNSQSLFEVTDRRVRIYVRYSKVHDGDKTFFGLRQSDLRELEAHPAVICFLWDGQSEPLLLPFHEYEEVFRVVSPAADGQYKAQVRLDEGQTDLYIARAGRFGVEGSLGWRNLDGLVDRSRVDSMPDLSHSQVQTLLGSIGSAKGFDVWIPASDRARLDWSMARRFETRPTLPLGFDAIANVLQEIDVVWVNRGSSNLSALFEVEHSTTIYSALLRFNDVHLTVPNLQPRFSVVASDTRHSVFVRQLNRPTFRASGLSERCTFLEYPDVYAWHQRLTRGSVLA